MKSPVKWRFLFVMVLMVDNLPPARFLLTTLGVFEGWEDWGRLLVLKCLGMNS